MTPDITVNVDPTNPGQFFACCGILEIAHRLSGYAEGWFGNGVFHVRANGGIRLTDILNVLKQGFRSSISDAEMQRLRKLLNQGDKGLLDYEKEAAGQLKAQWSSEIIYMNALDGFMICWWNDESTGGDRLKTWAGKQLVVDILGGLLPAAQDTDSPSEDILFQCTNVSILTFYLNSLRGSHSSDIDVGFSTYALSKNRKSKMESPAAPLCELLAFIGLQRFRPLQHQRSFQYKLWFTPSPPIIAALAQTVPIDPKTAGFSFSLMFRTKYLKAFLTAQPLSLLQR